MVLGVCILNVAFDGLFFLFGKVIVEHLKITTAKVKTRNLNSQEIGSIVSQHNKLYNWIEEVNRITMPSLLVQFFTIVAIICIFGYDMVAVRK